MKFNKKPLIVGLAAAAAVMTTAPTALAQSERATLEEVVVVARKRSESLQDVPIAVTAFTETAIKDAGIERPEDFISLTSNVSMLNTVNAGDTQVLCHLCLVTGKPFHRPPDSLFLLLTQ